MRSIIAILSILFVAVFIQLGYSASPETYLPLQEGMVWEFQHKFSDLKDKKQVDEAKAIKKNLAPVELKGTRVTPQVFSFYQPKNVLKQETTSFIAKEPNGYYVLARQHSGDKSPKFVADKFYILKFPLNKGTTWKENLVGMVMHNIIESTVATVTVPAGTFNNCLLIKKLYYNKDDEKKAVQESLLWFAPGVGNVKVVMKNYQNNQELTQELISFKK